jgi:guanylate kinase
LTKKLLEEFPHVFGLSISHTTRKPRGTEENAVHYHFVTKQEMEEGIERGSFVETANLFGHVYGTSFKSIDKVTEEGKICIIDLETEV